MPDTRTVIQHSGTLSQAAAERLYVELQAIVAEGRCPKSVFGIFIELVQNLRLHGGAEGELLLDETESGWQLRSTNRASQADATRACAAIERANELSEAALKEWILTRRQAALGKGARGAGLGLATMRRLSGQPIKVRCSALGAADYRLEIMLTVTHNDDQ